MPNDNNNAFQSILMHDVLLRGDLNVIKFGRFTCIKDRSVIRNPFIQINQGALYLKSHYGEYVMIDEDVVSEAVQVGSYVHIGKGCVLGNACIIKDCVYLKPGTVVPPNQVLENCAVYEGNPGKFFIFISSNEYMCKRYVMQ